MQQLEMNVKKKKALGRLGLVLVIALILLTFLSMTVNNLLMPNVTTVRYVKGSLQDKFEAEGTIEYSEKHKIIAGGSWKVKSVMGMPDQQVRKGDLLAVIDSSDIELDLKVMELEIMKLEDSILSYKDSYKPIRLSDYEKELQFAQGEMEKAKKDLDTSKEIFEAGGESLKNVEAAENVYNSKVNTYQSQKDILEDKKKESIINQDAYERVLKEKTSELEIKKMEVANKKNNITEDGMIFADMDGIITNVGIECGLKTAVNQVMFEVVKVPCLYRAFWHLDTENNYKFKTNDNVLIEATGEMPGNGERIIKTVSLTAKIAGKVFDAASGSYKCWADISFKEGAESLIFNEGQKVSVQSVVSSPLYEYLLPKGCISQVEGKDCIFVVRNKQGALGEEHYAEQREVKILGKDENNVAVDCYFKKGEMVVASSSKPLKDMVQVNITYTKQDDPG